MRENLGALGTSTREEKLRVRYVDLLDEQETRLAEILEMKKKNEKEIERLNGEVEKKLKALE